MGGIDPGGDVSPQRAVAIGMSAAPGGAWLRPIARVATPKIVAMIVAVAAANLILQGRVPEGALEAAARLALGVVGVGLAPGMLLVIAASPFRRIDALSLLGMGAAASAALLLPLCLLSQLSHVPATRVLSIALALVVLAGGATLLGSARRSKGSYLTVTRLEIGLLAAMAVVGLALYLKGEPLFFFWEDEIHVAVIRRLASAPAPALDNVYYIPGMLYTYPIPATHFFYALVAACSSLDPLFVFDKLRPFWALLATVYVALCARVFLGSRWQGSLASSAAVALMLSGAFGEVMPHWGQLTPYSHASDVAMNVFLPAALLVSLRFIGARSRASARFFLSLQLLLFALLTAVHIREMVQLDTYLACYCLSLLVKGRLRSRAFIRTLAAATAGAALMLVYTSWHREHVSHVTGVEAAYSAQIASAAQATSGLGWLIGPANIPCCSEGLGSYFFYGAFPWALLATLAAVVVFQRRALLALVSWSLLFYLLVLAVPLLSFGYLALTYHEILVTPIRNVVFFLYVLVGPGLFALARATEQFPRHVRACVSVVSALGVFVGGRALLGGATYSQVLFRHQTAFLVTMLVLVIATLLPATLGAADRIARRRSSSPSAWTLALAAAWLAALAAATARPEGSPLAVLHRFWPETLPAEAVRSPTSAVRPDRVYLTPSALQGAARCVKWPRSYEVEDGQYASGGSKLPRGQSCPIPPSVVRWISSHLSPDAVFSSNVFNGYPTSTLVPQQTVTWPVSSSGAAFIRQNFPDYYARYDASMRLYGQPPVFNSEETLAEKLQFLRDMKVTHVLVDPMTVQMMSAVLGRSPEFFGRVYSDGDWAVYEVKGLQR